MARRCAGVACYDRRMAVQMTGFFDGSRRSPGHLAFIRCLPCVGCGRSAPSESAHIRIGTDGGMGLKPSDRYCVPLCGGFTPCCHVVQHAVGERTFWASLKIDPFDVATALWVNSGDLKAGEKIVRRARLRGRLIDYLFAEADREAGE